jgi:hypothetical protein
MQLSSYQCLIAALPCEAQSAPTAHSTWNNQPACPRAILDYFAGQRETVISREDVFAVGADQPFDPSRFIAATILWGYPKGLRGQNLEKVASSYQNLQEHLRRLKEGGNRIPNWKAHWKGTVGPPPRLPGINLSTYTKFLYFLRTTIHEYTALILDDVVIRVLRESKFKELESLSKLSREKASRGGYVDYLKVMSQQADRLNTDPGRVEMFVHMFGRIIKAR